MTVNQPQSQSCQKVVKPRQLPWKETPLVRSDALSVAAGCNVFMKIEMLQPSGSFKSRGVGNLCLKALEAHPTRGPIHYLSSSGGNAGLAAAKAATFLGQHSTVIVPTSTTEMMKARIRAAGADVITHGATWREADNFLREKMAQEGVNKYCYCPPFDHPDVWLGNSSIVDEIKTQMTYGMAPDAIILSVGGGGLFNGVMEGLDRHGWSQVPVLAMETEGAESLHEALKRGELVTLPRITSIATSLGATRVSEMSLEYARRQNVRSVVLSDADAAMGCVRLADDERLIVEAACGVSAAACYSGVLKQTLPTLNLESNIILIVCGGSNVTVEMLSEYRQKYSYTMKGSRDADVPSTYALQL